MPKDRQFEFEEVALPLLDNKSEGIENCSSSEESIHLRQTGGGATTSHTHDPCSSSQYDTRNDEFVSEKPKRRTPLPLLQLFILCTTRLSEPIAYTQIFPYINEMVEHMKVTDKRQEIGYYSGIVDSIFAVCQLFTILQWGRLSDRIGRKPVILIGLSGVAVSTFLFGLARTFWWAVFARSLAGALSGNAAVSSSVIGEITDETNQTEAFPLMALSWSLGCIIGPMIGGNFVNPERNFPNTFGSIQLLRDYPYLLPCLVSSALTIASVIVGILFLKESLPSKVRLDPRLPSPIVTRYSEKKFTTKPKAEEISLRSILSSRSIRSIFRNYFLLSVCGTSFDVVFILLAYTPVHLGGLSRSPDEIGYALAFSGAAGALVQVFVFPRLQRRYSSIPLYWALMLLWPALFAILPLLAVLARWTAPPEAFAIVSSSAVVDAGMEIGGEVPLHTYPAGILLWTGIAIALAILRCGHMCYSLNSILTKNATPSQEALGTTFGLAQTVACVARAGSPAFVSSLFAISIRYGVLGGNLVWVVMFVVAMLAWWSTFYITDRPDEYDHPSLNGYQPLSTKMNVNQSMSSTAVMEECEMRSL
ncbi:MFS general substrate transporter [Pyrrhoderma noxium]|uniref:MFS general substrate transporter n=1 Tax=Pyrrhoderma noxium TaxID=2282107 RepID=A0A286ULL2_9AGAM|nr:MFS general substrate transporter [Pyrrhoderma noxium]